MPATASKRIGYQVVPESPPRYDVPVPPPASPPRNIILHRPRRPEPRCGADLPARRLASARTTGSQRAGRHRRPPVDDNIGCRTTWRRSGRRWQGNVDLAGCRTRTSNSPSDGWKCGAHGSGRLRNRALANRVFLTTTPASRSARVKLDYDMREKNRWFDDQRGAQVLAFAEEGFGCRNARVRRVQSAKPVLCRNRFGTC